MRSTTFLIGCYLLATAGGCAWMDWFSETADVTRSSELRQEVAPADLALPYPLPSDGSHSPSRAAPTRNAVATEKRALAGRPWPLSLPEAVRIGLANSQVVRVMDGGDVQASSVTTFDPAIAEARARAALAAFDPTLSASAYTNWIDEPPSSFFGPGLPVPNTRTEAGTNAVLVKPWLTGAQTRAVYSPLGFLYIPGGTSSPINPLSDTALELGVRQPMMRGAGVAVNKAPIRIARLRSEM